MSVAAHVRSAFKITGGRRRGCLRLHHGRQWEYSHGFVKATKTLFSSESTASDEASAYPSRLASATGLVFCTGHRFANFTLLNLFS